MNRLPAFLAISLACTGCSGPEAGLPPEYRHLALPEARLRSAEARERGRALFLEHCALCHGARGDGQGERRAGLSSRPRDLTDPAWRRRVTPRRLYFAIRQGVRGTAMPSWSSLPEAEVWDLVAFLLSLTATGESGRLGHLTEATLPGGGAGHGFATAWCEICRLSYLIPCMPIASVEIAPPRSRERASLKSSQPRSAAAVRVGRGSSRRSFRPTRSHVASAGVSSDRGLPPRPGGHQAGPRAPGPQPAGGAQASAGRARGRARTGR
jgi:mono/diheme cytochrome c family protein